MSIWHNLDPAAPALDAHGRRESPRANSALRDYLQSAAPRSLDALLAGYLHAAHAPARSLKTLKAWAVRFEWQARAAFHDQLQVQNAERAEAERLTLSMHSGMAVPAERVESLKQLYDDLLDYQKSLLKIWRMDLEPVEAEPGARPRVPRFSTALIIQLRGILDDLARETGGRAPRKFREAAPNEDISNAQAEHAPDLRLLSRQEIGQLLGLMRKASPGAADSAEVQTQDRQAALPGFEP